jgi:Tfp pilus assembly protein PilN
MTVLLLIAIVLGTTVTEQPARFDEISHVKLRDQYGHEKCLADHRGTVVVVTLVTAKRLRNIRPWEKELRQHFEAIDFLRITDVPEDSPASYQQIAEKLTERVPEGVSVLIDLDRLWATTLALDTDRPNLLLIDADGRLVESFRGKHSPDLAREVVEALQAIVGGP